MPESDKDTTSATATTTTATGGDSAATAADAAVAASQATTDTATGGTATSGTQKQEITYDLKLPDKSTLDPAMLERIAANARARGLTNEQAQADVELVNQEAASIADATMKAHAPGGDAWQKTVQAWEAETMADESLGKTVEERKAKIEKGKSVLRRFAETQPQKAEQFKAFLETSGIGSHPAAVGLLAWLGESAGEGSHVAAGKPSDGKQSIEERWYPDLAAKAKA